MLKPGEKYKLRERLTSSGFSLMEVLVAIYIIITALSGIMVLVTSINASSSVSSSKLVAANLAQEGIELVKSIRDFNLGLNGWDNWFAEFNGATCYYLQYDSLDLDNQIFCNEETPVLQYNSATGLYGYNGYNDYAGGADTPFAYRRKIILTGNPSGLNDAEIKVEVVVSWTEHNRSQTITVEDRLWNWR